MLMQEPDTDFPAYLDIDIKAFRKHKQGWLLWRTCGHLDAGGSFVPPVSFVEAQQMPKEEIDIYFELDRLLAIRQKQVKKS